MTHLFRDFRKDHRPGSLSCKRRQRRQRHRPRFCIPPRRLGLDCYPSIFCVRGPITLLCRFVYESCDPRTCADHEIVTEEKPVLTPDVIAEEHALSAHGLMLLSHLFKLHLPHYNDESTFPLFTCLASFTDPTDAWTSPQITSQAASLLETFTDPAHLPPLLHNLLTERIKPLFARSKNPAITAQGRKAIDPIPSNDTLHSDLDAENKPWKYRDVYIVTVFRWVLIHLDVCIISEIACHAVLSTKRRKNLSKRTGPSSSPHSYPSSTTLQLPSKPKAAHSSLVFSKNVLRPCSSGQDSGKYSRTPSRHV